MFQNVCESLTAKTFLSMPVWILTSEYYLNFLWYFHLGIGIQLFLRVMIYFCNCYQSSELGVLSFCSIPVFLVSYSYPLIILSIQICSVSTLKLILGILHYRYMLAEGLGLSGIVSILFTGIVSEQIVFYCTELNCTHAGTGNINDISVVGYEALYLLEFV